MPDSKTVIILGAGASKQYGFPTAPELKRMLLGELPDDFQTLKDYGLDGFDTRIGQWKPFLDRWFRSTQTMPHQGFLEEFRRVFAAADVDSIDQFVVERNQFADIAQYYVALILLVCEATLARTIRQGWYQRLWMDVIVPIYREDAPPLQIITFNYDRSLQMYLKTTANAYFADKAEEVLKKVQIQHVYGSLGDIHNGSANPKYGRIDGLLQACERIQLMPPRTKQNDEIRSTILKCDRAVFLGFSFDPLNMEVLGINPGSRPEDIFASCYRLSAPAIARADRRLGKIEWGDKGHKLDDFIHHSLAFA